ncbi:uncharacterized protein LOC132701391 [Cylas formicarius]|uniref:uncharacterized protein LOC132701391 n=1 Tax=Cylas formicarius TaxID=197179 RepID=UPI0029585CBA|nr:uncharacterized protein LOC132701391 [Cylas formicarius]XP_060525248.1 uncharacterized protein LOC132701391 [Cylas formicarius]XP_060525249.1 uncharacterized protein LOC132701391 [Cylas formicarius]
MSTFTCPNEREEFVVQQLTELFGSSFEVEVIKGTAKTCNYNVHKASNKLLEMSNNKSRSPKKKSRKSTDLENAIININKGYKVLVLLRGLPGSGKSTLARNILQNTIGCSKDFMKYHILSTDDYFMKNGIYRYDSTKIGEAHGWNHQRAFNSLSKGYSPIIIDNTNTEMWEMKAYAVMAMDYGYIIEILEPDTHWCFNETELAKRNKHGVSKFHIRNMLDRFEKNVTPTKLCSAYDCRYKLQKPPQMRSYPPVEQQMPKVSSTTENVAPVHNSPRRNPFEHAPSPVIVEEIINLMDFNEDSSNSLSTSKNVPFLNKNVSFIDNLLMYQGTSPVQSSILTPVQTFDMKQSTFSNIETTWGINEQALRSWDIVTPLKEVEPVSTKPIILTEDEVHIETKNSSCNTDDDIFVLFKSNSNVVMNDVTIRECCGRDINKDTVTRRPGISKKLMLDKSCLTDDYLDDKDIYIAQLTALFPDVPNSHLNYWYGKCKGDIEWTIELLLAQKDDIIILSDDELEESKQQHVNENNDIPLPMELDQTIKPKPKSPTNEESMELKKCIEKKVTINENCYSDHLKKIRNRRNGAPELSPTSETPAVDYEAQDAVMEFIYSDNECGDWEIISQADDALEEESMEINLGQQFVEQLERRFGEQSLVYPKGFQPVVQVPVSLAKQLYTFYIESVFQQMEAQNSVLDTMVKEDEEFARKLQEEEETSISKSEKSSSEPRNFQEIVNEQAELSKLEREAGKWKELTPDTLAAKLTLQKLFKAFPYADQTSLVEILHAHNNVYKDTVETLLASFDPQQIVGDVQNIKESPLEESVIKEMKNAQQTYKQHQDKGEERSAQSYRDEANQYYVKRSDLYQKANEYRSRGMTEVALFYSNLASWQTVYWERANSMAAMAFVDEHSKRLQDFNTLDLHFLYVKEVVPALDMFIDRNINLLRHSATKQTEYLQIITGRGKRSENGKPKIKPVVEARLRRRKIIYQHLNPGLLKIKVTKLSLVTNELQNISDPF